MHIKDTVYGDIEITDKFKVIIDTPEFQRLRRIKQLAMANLVFPAANHSRFEHSIGTFHVMGLIVKHFIDFFTRLDDKILFDKTDIDAVLMAALLHDIGHGPFSHAFEQALENNFDHELMTCKIITSQETEINGKLREYFGDDFPEKVVKYIDLRNEYKGNTRTGEGKQSPKENIPEQGYNHLKNSFFGIFHNLVSSQLDADRMDYILRDSKETGIPFGFSINDLILSLQLTYFDDNYHICVSEKYMNHVENYLYARHQMYRNVYMNSHKLFSEELLKGIIKRAQFLFESKKGTLTDLSPVITNLLSGKALEIVDFCKMDDNIIMSAIRDWMSCNDIVLSELCKSFMDRSGFEKIVLLSNNEEDIASFKDKFLSFLKPYLISSAIIKKQNFFDNCNFWIENTRYYFVYDENSAKIYIQCENGLIKELSEASSSVKSQKETVNICYINFGLLKSYLDENKKDNADSFSLVEGVKSLISDFTFRNHLEIESKYIIKPGDEDIFDDILRFVSSIDSYSISDPVVQSQNDEYYDYDDHHLRNSDISLRIRSIKKEYIVTYKEATGDATWKSMGNQMIRVEKEIHIRHPDIKAHWKKIIDSIPETARIDINKLKKILIVTNNRKKSTMSKDNFILEIAFDDVTYHSGDRKYKEKQIEIELKSAYEYKINLRIFTEMLENRFKGRLERNSKSKFERGLAVFE